MSQTFRGEKELFLPRTPLEMTSIDMGSDAASATITAALLKYRDGVAVVTVDNPIRFWEAYAPKSCKLSQHRGEGASSVWGFRTGPVGPPEFGQYDFDEQERVLARVSSPIETSQADRAIVFAERFHTAAQTAHREQQMLVALRDFCAEQVIVPEYWSIGNSVVTIMHPQFTLYMDYRPVIPLGPQVLGTDGGSGTEDAADLFLYFYDIEPNGENGPTTLDEAIELFIPSGFSLDV